MSWYPEFRPYISLRLRTSLSLCSAAHSAEHSRLIKYHDALFSARREGADVRGEGSFVLNIHLNVMQY